MIDKRVETMGAALDGLEDGARIMISGFGGAGFPHALLQALAMADAGDLTLIVNALCLIEDHQPEMAKARRIRRVICSGARNRGSQTSIFESPLESP